MKEKKNVKKTDYRKGSRGKQDKKRDFAEEKKGSDYIGDSKLKSDNDMKWYSLNKGLIEASGRLPFGKPQGNPIELRINRWTGAWAGSQVKCGVPGIMAYSMRGAVGCSVDGIQSIDVASKSIYSFVRHANSGHSNYDSTDLMLYLLAAREVYAAAGWMLRLFGILNTFHATNRYYGEALLQAHTGLSNVSWMWDEIANIRYYCSQYFKRAASIYTPKTLPLFEKAFWIYTQIYEEDKTGKAGIYLYAPDGFYSFNATKYTSGGCLEYSQLAFTDMASFRTYFNNLLEPIINDEDMGIMSGDIKKAFENNIWDLGDFPFECTITPIYDSFVLQQMHNTKYITVDTTVASDIVQDNTKNEILWFPQYVPGTNYNASFNNVIEASNNGTVLIDIDSEVPSVDEVIEATQYTNCYYKVGLSAPTRISTYNTITSNPNTGNKTLYIVDVCDFLCVRVTVFKFTEVSGVWTLASHTLNDQIISDNTSDNPLTATAVAQLFADLSVFTFLPFIGNYPAIPYIGSLHNYTITQWNIIRNIHDACWLSLLAIPAQEHLK